jgi:transposase
MGRCYSLDLRVRVAAFVEAGHSRRAAARHFGVSDSFAIKLVRRQRQAGSPRDLRQHQGDPPTRAHPQRPAPPRERSLRAVEDAHLPRGPALS